MPAFSMLSFPHSSSLIRAELLLHPVEGTYDFAQVHHDGFFLLSSDASSILNPMAEVTDPKQFQDSLRPKVTFPLPIPPTNPYWQGPPTGDRDLDQVRFGWPREHGARRHAAVDLEAPVGTSVLAMADGVVLRVDRFYLETNVIEVLHPGVGIVRYGEIDPASCKFRPRTVVRQGDRLAAVGQRFERVKGRRVPQGHPMLHLELFSDLNRIALTSEPDQALSQLNARGGPYQRRDDLKDPTSFVHSASPYRPAPESQPTDARLQIPATPPAFEPLYASIFGNPQVHTGHYFLPMERLQLQALLRQAPLSTGAVPK